MINHQKKAAVVCKKYVQYAKGFTLLELLLVIAIMALLSTAGVGSYRGYLKSVEIQSVTEVLASDLRSMRSKSMIGEEGQKWGAHVVNVNNGNHYYELFSTLTNYSSGTVLSTTTLPSGVTFSEPGAGLSSDIIFSKISGTTTPATITITSEGATKSLTVSNIGTINF